MCLYYIYNIRFYLYIFCGMNEETTKERTPCQVFTRVMGYIRPVQNYNLGKKSEFYSRKYFSKKKLELDNQEFIKKYMHLNAQEQK